MAFAFAKKIFPTWQNILLAIIAAVLLILAFPDFECWFLAWFALVPLMWAVERQKHCVTACFLLGWLFGTIFFFGTCWWLAYAPIHYASFPPLLAYSLIMIACLGAGIFPGIFTVVLSLLLRRFGSWAFLAAPFVWVACEFARYWITGNNWNAIGYSQAFVEPVLRFVPSAGVLLISFLVSSSSALVIAGFTKLSRLFFVGLGALMFFVVAFVRGILPVAFTDLVCWDCKDPYIISIQGNIPASGLDSKKWNELRERQFSAAQAQIDKLKSDNLLVTTVVLPESPMNFMYDDDREFQWVVGDFARQNNVSVLFNSSEPDKGTTKYFNSAVMVGPDGNKVAEYDKIYLLPFGEAVPGPLDQIMPAFVGSFAYGSNYTLLPVGDAKAGVMICFESHFGQLSREYVRNGADVIIEMTNDGYLGPTPVLRQHLANAVFRAVETNRPVLRVTNVGITAYINERGEVLDATTPYQEDTRVWSVSKSDGSQTFYVKYGDWFAWLCSIVTLPILGLSLRRRNEKDS